jgi:hypothetical protein
MTFEFDRGFTRIHTGKIDEQLRMLSPRHSAAISGLFLFASTSTLESGGLVEWNKQRLSKDTSPGFTGYNCRGFLIALNPEMMG